MGRQINVNIRMDSDVKENADILFGLLGFNLTTAVNAFVRQAIREQAIPFQIRASESPAITRNELLLEGRKILGDLQKESVKNGTDNISMDEINAIIADSRRCRTRR